MGSSHQQEEPNQCRHVLCHVKDRHGSARQIMSGVGFSAAHVIAVHVYLVLHEIGNVIKGERNAGVVIQQEAVACSCVVVNHQLLHSPQHFMTHCLSAISVIPVHCAAQHS